MESSKQPAKEKAVVTLSSSSFEEKSKDAPIREEYHTKKNHKSKKEEASTISV